MDSALSNSGVGLPRDQLLALYESMLRIRRIEEKIVEVYPEQEMRCPTHLSTGQEAVAAGIMLSLRTDDKIFSTHRCHAHYIAKGGNLRSMIAELYGRKTGCTGGKGGSMHLTDESIGMMGTSAIVGQAIPLAVGAALAFSMKGTDQVAISFFGDAAVEQGVFHESLNFAALRKLPVVFVNENNLYSTQTPIARRQVIDNIYKRGEIYGIPGVRIDGNDAQATYQAGKEAVDRARNGQGPSLIECRTYRWLEHVGPYYDWDLGYRTKEEGEQWMSRCPVQTWEKRILSSGTVSSQDIAHIKDKIENEVSAAFLNIKDDPLPGETELFENLF